MAMLVVFFKIALGIPQNALGVKDTQANGRILPLSESAKQLESCFARNPIFLGDEHPRTCLYPGV